MARRPGLVVYFMASPAGRPAGLSIYRWASGLCVYPLAPSGAGDRIGRLVNSDTTRHERWPSLAGFSEFRVSQKSSYASASVVNLPWPRVVFVFQCLLPS